jgi:ribosomal protein L29
MDDPKIEENAAHIASADEFVAQEVEKTKKALKQTQVIGIAVFLFIFFYIGSIALKFQRSLQPNEAALMAKGMIAQRVMDGEPELNAYLMKEVPAIIEKAPDYAMEQLPSLRTQLEDRLASEFHQYAEQTSKQLDTSLDEYLETNKEDFKTVMLAGSDPSTTQEMMGTRRKMFIDYLDQKNGDDESIKTKIDESLKALGEIKAMMKKLSDGKNLTPAEQKTRRAIAVLLTTIDEKKAEEPLPSGEEVINTAKATYGLDN